MTPNKEAEEWEKRFDKQFFTLPQIKVHSDGRHEIPEIKAFIHQLLKEQASRIIESIPDMPPHPYDGIAAIHYYKILKQQLKSKYL